MRLPPAGADFENAGESVRGTDEFVGLRPPLPGESLSRIAWKAWARTGQLLAKDYRSGAGSAWLDWNAIPATDPEERLSLLTRLVIDAEAAGQFFGLRLPGIELPADGWPGPLSTAASRSSPPTIHRPAPARGPARGQ